MIHYPLELQIIFDKLEQLSVKPIIVGGFVRDALLGIKSKDIDIELYGINSLLKVEDALREFGSLNSVGKSFGVCKLRYKSYDLDFSLPRKDNKTQKGHKGFEVFTDENLDFKTASSRRDFTLNAIGFDVQEKIILDPFNGLFDLQSKILKAVNLSKFDEDPLRVLRCVAFASRFNFKIEEKLFLKCKEMINKKMLSELASERIFTEFEKILLNSKKPSLGLSILDSFGAFSFFVELDSLSLKEKNYIYKTLDTLSLKKIKDKKEKLILMLALLCQSFSQTQRDSFLLRLTHEHKIFKDVTNILNTFDETPLKNFNNYEVYLLATKIEIRLFILFLRVKSSQSEKKFIDSLEQKALELNVYKNSLPAFINGKELILLGLKPSPEFSKILHKTYDAQMRELFFTKEEAIQWLQKYLFS